MALDIVGGFDPKIALAEWKKAKPLLMPETGIGELLRGLPPAPAPEQLAKYTEIQGKLKAKLADPKVKKEAKAVKFVDNISKDIGEFVHRFKESREHVVQQLGIVSKAMHDFQAILEAHADEVPKLRAAYVGCIAFIRKNAVDPRSYKGSRQSIFPDNVGGNWVLAVDDWDKAVCATIDFLASDKPKPDPAGHEAVERIKACKAKMDRAVALAATVKAI